MTGMRLDPDDITTLIGALEDLERPLSDNEGSLLLAARLKRRRNNRPPTVDQINDQLATRLAVPTPKERRVRRR